MRFKGAYLGCFGMILLPALPFIVMPQFNNWRLTQFQAEFAQLSHPANSEYVARFSNIDNFGNGDHVDFVVTELRVKTGVGQISEFYKDKTILVPNAEDDDFQRVKNGQQPLDVRFLPSPLPPNYQVKHGHNEGWNLNFAAGRKNLYIVEVLNSGENYNFNSMFDIRS